MPRWYFEDLTPGFVLEADGPNFGALCASGWHPASVFMRIIFQKRGA